MEQLLHSQLALGGCNHACRCATRTLDAGSQGPRCLMQLCHTLCAGNLYAADQAQSLANQPAFAAWEAGWEGASSQLVACDGEHCMRAQCSAPPVRWQPRALVKAHASLSHASLHVHSIAHLAGHTGWPWLRCTA